MSFDFKTIKHPSNDPIMQFIAAMQQQNALKVARDQVDQLDDTEDIFSDSQQTETKVSFQTMNTQHKFRFNKPYYAPVDPGLIVPCWLRGYNVGNEMRDFSMLQKHPGIIKGEPILVDGVMDLGIFDEATGFKSTAIKVNRPLSPEENGESFHVIDHTDIQIAAITTAGQGFSIFMRFKMYSFAQQGSLDRTLCTKIDDSTPTNAYQIRVTNSGRLRFYVKKGGSLVVDKETTNVVINTTDIFGLFVTYAVTGNVAHIYTWKEDGTPTPTVTDQALTTIGGGDPTWQADLTNHDLWVFKRGAGSAGYVYGDFYDWEMYRPQGSFTGIVSSTQVGYRSVNKMSISNIPFGQVCIANHWATFSLLGPASFTAASFTGTSFNI